MSDFNTDNNKKEENIRKEVKIGLSRIGFNIELYSDTVNSTRSRFSETEYGCCHNCDYFFAIKRRYGNKGGAICEYNSRYIFRLDTVNPIVECSKYEEVGKMTINQMQEIATIINVEKKEKIGIIK